MKSINKGLQDYFIKLAPDFSVFDLAEKYFYDMDLNITTNRIFKDVFLYSANTSATQRLTEATPFYRAMFLVYSDGDLSINAPEDEYTVFPFKTGAQILIAIQKSPIIITSTANIEMMIGVAF